ncbi:synaptopodin 2-like protein [Xenia sp. Carnegie-2017]|uniref:synaptopodin 2-like protein n=1 Tax=Xenia sp. Carnegie-2017 TaxID=2897299 RepID=UPI001F04FE79|nr:synaptopodin 2-like protein [Xenia sp. Carnegie-2017]
MASDTFEVLLQGGSPWGFRLQGGKEFGAPLLIARVTDGSKAEKNGILVGDVLISINHESCETMTHTNALNYIKKSGNELHLTLDRRPFDSNDPYAYKSLPRGTKLTNGDVLKNSNYSNKTEYKSVESYATLPRKKQSKNSYVEQTDLDDHVDGERPDSLGTRSSSGVSSKYTEDDDELLPKAIGVISPSNDQWSPDLISDAVRPPQPIKLISEPDSKSIKYSTDARIKSPTTIRGFTDKPSPVGRGARRNFDEENTDSADNHELLTSGSSYTEDIPSDDDAAAEKPYRRYSYHGSVLKDNDDRKNNDTTERPVLNIISSCFRIFFICTLLLLVNSTKYLRETKINELKY